MKIEATRADAYDLFHKGTQALSDVEGRGIKVDRTYCRKTIERLNQRTEKMEEHLLSNKFVKRWKKKEGSKFKLGSNTQLANLLYRDLEFKKPAVEEEEEDDHTSGTLLGRKGTAGPVDEATLRRTGEGWLMEIVRWRKLQHAVDQLEEILREQVDGFMHPMFNLGGSSKDSSVRSYRSACEHINFQNKNARDKEIAEIVRRAFVARHPKNVILEADFKGIEVGVSCCNHHDPNMISYVKDETKDMHRDQSVKCFKLPKKEVSKTIRHIGKNGFVFPEFYGSYWKNVGPAMWQSVLETSPEIVSGKKLMQHLKEQGIGSPTRFTNHIKAVEWEFWNDLFEVYTEWKNEFWAAYLKRGYFDTLTGFRCSGDMTKNSVLNYPIQGPAFHCLLWCLTRLNKTMAKMGALIMGQIHDSMLTDLPEKLVPEVVDMQREVSSILLPRHWPWICVPMRLEWEVTPPGGSWWEKTELKAA